MTADPEQPPGVPAAGLFTRELAVRALSGAVMAAVTIGLIYSGHGPFAVLIAVLAAVASWEWGKIVRGTGNDAMTAVHALIASGATLGAAFGYMIPALIGLLVGSVVLVILRLSKRDLLTSLGALCIGFPAVGLVWIRGDVNQGLLATLFLFVIVWLTDSGAYVAGRAIGGPKMLASISPNKTWAGAIGGIAAAAAGGAAFAELAAAGTPATLAFHGACLAVAAEIGDLAESALKRRFGRKESSAIIPGHGGLLDRVDGLMMAAAAAALFALATNPASPGNAILGLG